MAQLELTEIGGLWGRRLARRRRAYDTLPLGDLANDLSEEDRARARWVWTESVASELASAAAFAQIASALIAAGAPVDLSAAAGEFVSDEIVHAEVSASVAMALGGAAPLDLDLGRLVRPPEAGDPLLAAAELLLRTSCIGESLTLPLLKQAERVTTHPALAEILAAIARDEGPHAELGYWFLDWADDRLDDAARAHLGKVASFTVRSYAQLFGRTCSGGAPGAGVLDCTRYDAAFAHALRERVAEPLAQRGIEVDVAVL